MLMLDEIFSTVIRYQRMMNCTSVLTFSYIWVLNLVKTKKKFSVTDGFRFVFTYLLKSCSFFQFLTEWLHFCAQDKSKRKEKKVRLIDFKSYRK